MEDFTIGDLGVFIGTIGGVITSILIVLQKSSCVKIKCCGFECMRDPKLVKKHIIENPAETPRGTGIQSEVDYKERKMKEDYERQKPNLELKENNP